MQTLDVHQPGIPDLQFVLMVLALCSSDLDTLNIPPPVRRSVFDRCWAMLYDTPPPTVREERVLDLREGDDLALHAMVEVIRSAFDEYGITNLTWDHPPSAPSQQSTPAARPLVDRLQQLFPARSDAPDLPPTGDGDPLS
jgi:hypothetical protein